MTFEKIKKFNVYIYPTLRSNDFIDDFIKIFDTFEKTKK